MTILGHGAQKYPRSELIGSSKEHGCTGIFAERRFHPAGDIPLFTPSYTEVAMLIRGRAILSRRVNGLLQRTVAAHGTIWLSPSGVTEEMMVMSQDPLEIAHIYLPSNPFVVLESYERTAALEKARLWSHSGFHDLLLEQLANSILLEMRHNTIAGRILIEALARSVAARLLHSYSSISLKCPALGATPNRLAARKLRQVLDFIEAHIADNLTVEQMASVACLSQFHFAREFKAATGQSPYQLLTERRIVHAKALLTETDRSVVDIALACGFASTGSFCRVFCRVIGATPGRYRAGLTNMPTLRASSDA